MKQAFFRMAEVILEVVATGRGGDEPAQFWGLTFLSDDLDATLALSDPIASARLVPRCRPDAASRQSASRSGSACPSRSWTVEPLHVDLQVALVAEVARDLLGVLLHRRG